MPTLYKEGVYWLVLLAVTSAAYVALMVFVGPIRATAAFGLLGFAGLQPLLYRKRSQAVVWDERDTQIAHRAVIAGYSIFWLAFTLGIMGLWGVYFCSGQETISVHVLPLLVLGGTFVFMTVRAIAIVIQYRLQDSAKGE
jgi:uncharacterized membrane protein